MTKSPFKPYPISSYELTKWAIKQTPRIKTDKLVLISLCDHVNNKTGRCDPSLKTLADVAMCSERVAMRAIKSLESDGFIKTHKLKGIRTRYVINYTSDTHNTTVQKTSDAHVTTVQKTSDAHVTTTRDAHVTQPLSPTSHEQSITKYIQRTEIKQTAQQAVEHPHNIDDDGSDEIFSDGDGHKQQELPGVGASSIEQLCDEFIVSDDRNRFIRAFRLAARHPVANDTLFDCLSNKIDESGGIPIHLDNAYGYLKNAVNSLDLDGVRVR